MEMEVSVKLNLFNVVCVIARLELTDNCIKEML